MSTTCEYCIYFDGVYCRRNAPSAALSGSTKVVWPQVSTEDWCAEGYNETDGYYDKSPDKWAARQ